VHGEIHLLQNPIAIKMRDGNAVDEHRASEGHELRSPCRLRHENPKGFTVDCEGLVAMERRIGASVIVTILCLGRTAQDYRKDCSREHSLPNLNFHGYLPFSCVYAPVERAR
jgi:hypothetical protein